MIYLVFILVAAGLGAIAMSGYHKRSAFEAKVALLTPNAAEWSAFERELCAD